MGPSENEADPAAGDCGSALGFRGRGTKAMYAKTARGLETPDRKGSRDRSKRGGMAESRFPLSVGTAFESPGFGYLSRFGSIFAMVRCSLFRTSLIGGNDV